jgi:hypothetical protein
VKSRPFFVECKPCVAGIVFKASPINDLQLLLSQKIGFF